jgi:hypothetical protein
MGKMMRKLLIHSLHALGFYALVHTAAIADDLSFTEVVLDERPLASNRVNDVALADIDGDGLLDIWLSGRNGRNHQSAWYKNPGDRRTAWQRFPFAEGSWKYGDLGDLDGDGDIDLVAGYDREKMVYWAENTGSPEKAPWPKHFLGITGSPDQLLDRDLDGDGKMEIVAFYKNGPIRVLRRPQDARQPWIESTIDDVAGGTAGGSVGDIDNDGDLDIVFGNGWYENPAPEKDWRVGGNWKRHVVDAGWPRESRSVVADIDGDGRNDLLLCAEESDHGVSWYRNLDAAPPNGGSWRRTKVNQRPYSKLHSCQAADFNADGKLDIFVAEMHTSAHRRIAVFLQGKDSSEWIEKVVSNVGSHNAKVADIDGDGIPDIVGKNFERDMRPRIWYGAITKIKLPLDRWKSHLLMKKLPYQTTFIRAGDLNGDGRPEIVTGGWWWENPGWIESKWRRHEFGGGLKNAAVVYDFDGDGLADVLGTDGTVRGGRFYLAMNSGGGNFAVKKIAAPSRGDFLQGAVAGRLDGDGVQVVLSWHNGDRVSPKIGTELLHVPDNIAGDWKLEQLSALTNEEEIALGDIDGDGRVDIHLGTDWLRNMGGGKFERREGLKIAKGSVDRLRLADVDNDGDLDVVIGLEHAKGLIWGENRKMDDAVTWIVHPIAADFLHMSLDLGDIDGDGDIDVVSGAHKKRGEVMLYENLGKGARWKGHLVDSGAPNIDHHMGTQLVDLDGDGDLDIISVGWRDRSVTIYENLAINRNRNR